MHKKLFNEGRIKVKVWQVTKRKYREDYTEVFFSIEHVHCDSASVAYFGGGTKLTVLGKNQNIHNVLSEVLNTV